jgi:hypothetical protein
MKRTNEWRVLAKGAKKADLMQHKNQISQFLPLKFSLVVNLFSLLFVLAGEILRGSEVKHRGWE